MQVSDFQEKNVGYLIFKKGMQGTLIFKKKLDTKLNFGNTACSIGIPFPAFEMKYIIHLVQPSYSILQLIPLVYLLLEKKTYALGMLLSPPK